MSSEITRVANPMTAKEPTAPVIEQTALTENSNNALDVAKARDLAEVQAQVFMAKRFTRDESKAMERILNACTRTTLAEKAVYEYVKGGQSVSGPSIRLAEAMAQAWGNLKFGVRELSQSKGGSECEAYCWDLESNTYVSKTFHVRHLRHTKRGDYLVTDPREIFEMVANSGARRLRSCILATIPGDVVEAAVEQCNRTLVAKVDVTPERIKAMIDKFAEFGVSVEQIEAFCQRKISAVTPAMFVRLGNIYTSIRDGMGHAADFFPPVATVEGGDGAADCVSDRGKSAVRSALARARSGLVKTEQGAGGENAL